MDPKNLPVGAVAAQPAARPLQQKQNGAWRPPQSHTVKPAAQKPVSGQGLQGLAIGAPILGKTVALPKVGQVQKQAIPTSKSSVPVAVRAAGLTELEPVRLQKIDFGFDLKTPERPKIEAQKPPETQKATVETPTSLELSKEILPGLSEVHHVDEPIKLPSQITDAGISSMPLPAGAALPQAQPLVLPFSQAQIKQHLHDSLKKSARWLAEWCVKQIKEAHLQIKRQTKKVAL